RRQRAQEIAEVVGERMKLEPHRVGGKRSARQSRPLDRAFALLDPLLARPALVVESNDALGRAAHVRHDEADAGIKFSGIGMPLDLGDNPPCTSKGYPPVKRSSMLLATSSQTAAKSSSSCLPKTFSDFSASCRYIAASCRR